MKYVSLPNSKRCFVDDEDFPVVSRYKWYAAKGHNTLYAVTTLVVNNRAVRMSMHRFIMNPTADRLIDHLNFNGLDNRKCNLRIVTCSENAQHSRKQKNTSSKYIGVTRVSVVFKRPWEAKIKKNGKTKLLGYFFREIEAARAYNAAAHDLFGKNAMINNV